MWVALLPLLPLVQPHFLAEEEVKVFLPPRRPFCCVEATWKYPVSVVFLPLVFWSEQWPNEVLRRKKARAMCHDVIRVWCTCVGVGGVGEEGGKEGVGGVPRPVNYTELLESLGPRA